MCCSLGVERGFSLSELVVSPELVSLATGRSLTPDLIKPNISSIGFVETEKSRCQDFHDIPIFYGRKAGFKMTQKSESVLCNSAIR